MKVIAADQPFDLKDGNHFYELEIEVPQPKGQQVLVKVSTMSVNPVDGKTRQKPIESGPRILGFDAVGIVEDIGSDVTLFKKGDRVYYSGSPDYQGSNAEYQIVDERLVALAPNNLSDEEAASLPLTSLTASETLFDVFNISKNSEDNRGKTILIINGAGGVGSITTQIAKQYGLKVITTASRQETIEWSKKMGADLVLNHHKDLVDQLKSEHGELVDYVFCTFDTDLYYKVMIDLVKPRGHLATIVAMKNAQDLNALKPKSISFTHEFMFARPTFKTNDMIKHHEYLTDVTEKVEKGDYQSTLTKVISTLTPQTLYEAHQLLESNEMIGKLVIKI